MRAGCHIYLAPDNRMNSLFFGFFIKVYHPEHHAVIGDGNRSLSPFLNRPHQILDAAGAVQQTIFGMQVQMCKAHKNDLLWFGVLLFFRLDFGGKLHNFTQPMVDPRTA